MLVLSSCYNKPKLISAIPALDSTIIVKNISINDLTKQYKSLQGQYIETEGVFFSGVEEFAIYTNKSFLSNKQYGFWMETNCDLHLFDSNWKHIEKIQGRTVIVKGRIDTSSHGHLGQYLATITNIYFFKEK
jgi:hypothetical protein